MEAPEVRNVVVELRSLTVDNLKRVIRGFNEEGVSMSTLGGNLKLSGTKADLFSRVCQVCRTAHTSNRAKFDVAVDIVQGVISGSGSSPASHRSYGGYQTSNCASSSNAYGGGSYDQYGSSGYGGYQQPSAARPPVNNYNQATNGYGASGSGSGASGPLPAHANHSAGNTGEPIKFRTSPFYRVEKALSSITHMPRAGQGDRKSVVVNFAIPEAQRTLLLASRASSSAKQYQVRLYCTTEDYFNVSRPGYTQAPAPIEFPATCEIKLNYAAVAANTKGIKKQAGTAPPVELSKGAALSVQSGGINRLEIVYINTEKRHSIIVYFVEVTSIDQLVARVRNGTVRSRDEVVRKIVEMNSDPDVEASSFGLSLKDPLTMARISLPARSTNCNHIACFDAKVFFMINEQTPAWSCPICSKVLKVEDLFVDGYLQDVLKGCSSDVDQVSVEPDGSWHLIETEEQSNRPSRAGSVKADPDGPGGGDWKGKGRAEQATESLTLDDSSDEDGPPLVQRRSNGIATATNGAGSGTGTGTSTPRGNKRPQMETLDLTLSDSDDDGPPPARTSPAPPPIRIHPPAATTSRPGSANASYSVPPPRPSSSASNGSTSSHTNGYNGARGVDAPRLGLNDPTVFALKARIANSALPPRPTGYWSSNSYPYMGNGNGNGHGAPDPNSTPRPSLSTAPTPEGLKRRLEDEEAARKRRRDVNDYAWARDDFARD